ncbi:MAG: 2'-5' RNA ligase family protein [Reichenbachiella sp.]|uniref:2'-5' RNA ligase family protein n=1 Tax=Reichenbachiella sp. TaxID=2184521 RepID=UPI0032638985
MTKPELSMYFLALIPGGEIKSEIMAFKEEVSQKFNSKGALKSPPHITLHMPFKWRTDREEALVDLLKAFKFEEFPLAIDLDGFDFFEPRVVFVHVVKNEPLQSLHQELTAYVRKSLKIFNSDYKDRGFHPHLTIGFRDLKKPAFFQAKAYYEKQDYRRKFMAKNICLLRHDGQRWQEWKYLSS